MASRRNQSKNSSSSYGNYSEPSSHGGGNSNNHQARLFREANEILLDQPGAYRNVANIGATSKVPEWLKILKYSVLAVVILAVLTTFIIYQRKIFIFVRTFHIPLFILGGILTLALIIYWNLDFLMNTFSSTINTIDNFIIKLVNRSGEQHELFSKEDVLRCFEALDEDKDGYLTFEELKTALKLPDQDIQDMIDIADTRGNGTLDYREYVRVGSVEGGAEMLESDEQMDMAESFGGNMSEADRMQEGSELDLNNKVL